MYSHKFSRYVIRLGTKDLNEMNKIGNLDVRRVEDILFHPKYVHGEVYYDVGIAVANKPMDFNDHIRPICLPYLPVDDENLFSKVSVISVGWKNSQIKKTRIEVWFTVRL